MVLPATLPPPVIVLLSRHERFRETTLLKNWVGPTLRRRSALPLMVLPAHELSLEPICTGLTLAPSCTPPLIVAPHTRLVAFANTAAMVRLPPIVVPSAI